MDRSTGRFSPPLIFSPFVDLAIDPDLLAGYPSAYRAGARHCRCRLRIITSLLLPSPEEAWEPYCSRKPSLTLSFSFFLSRFSLSARHDPLVLALSAVLLFASGFFLDLSSSSSSSCLPPLCDFLSTGWRTTCRARATEFCANLMEIARVSEISSTGGFYDAEYRDRHRSTRRYGPYFCTLHWTHLSFLFL